MRAATAEALSLEKARALLTEHPPGPVLDPNDPRPGAEEFVQLRHTYGGARTLHAQGGQLYKWTGTHYRELEEAEFRAQAWEYMASAFRWRSSGKKEEPDMLVPFAPTTTRVNNFVDAARSFLFLPASTQAPCWLHGHETAPPEVIVAMENGLLDVGARQLHPHSPRFFNRNALGFRYDPENAAPPLQWIRFLRDLWPEDEESIRVLQETFGYALTADTRQQKAFLLVGPKRSGKGTIARVLRALLGEANVCAPTLAGLATNFGMQPLIGKMLAVISDARLSSRTDPAVIAERLLSISGEYAITIDRKHLPSWTGKLPTRFLILSNELPRLADTSGALASRFVVLTLEQSFYGREDPQLTERLLRELPGIFLWALDGWDRLTERGHFIQPATSAEAIQEMEELGSPISAFIRDCCKVGPGRQIECKALYEAWRSWCQSEGRDHAGTAQTFGRDLRAAVPGLKQSQPWINGRRTRTYEGIGIGPL